MGEQPKQFPILNHWSDKGPKRYVPWSVAEQAREQAYRNHSQSLERLDERGGLSVVELAGALTGLSYWQLGGLNKDAAEEIIAAAIRAKAKGQER
jgi:hypothetical protein